LDLLKFYEFQSVIKITYSFIVEHTSILKAALFFHVKSFSQTFVDSRTIKSPASARLFIDSLKINQAVHTRAFRSIKGSPIL
jgi:hypothetical protein